ncbi:TonB-dependent receptor domain-containing protein [uncultured Draconibacterium sp.]|uniref:TonB-dependent receptor family protein n=1 Tax=uncultured Draconibacterium sp. TaxID=1573823 RepID=UPI002AA83F31|nr:TonB-dependent receptor [uncultured Draconibacterium sp.]
MKTNWITFIFLLVLWGPTPSGIVNAQSPFTRQDTTPLSDQIEEITITAFRSPYNIFNTPAPVNLLQPEQLESGDALTPIDALNRIPGVLMHHGTFNTNRLTIRGIGSRTPYGTNKIKAYFGEIPLTTGDGETVLEDLENSAIQRVEIIKGPSSSLYGAGLAGVLLFHPRTVAKDFVQNKTTLASFGTYKNTLSAGVNSGRLQIYTLGSLLSGDGYRENNSTKRGNVLINSVYNFSNRSNLQFLVKATKMKAYIPSSLDMETFQNNPESAASNWLGVKGFEEYTTSQLGISFNRFTLNDGKISVGVFGSTRDLDELRPFNRLKESSDYIGWRAYIQKVIATTDFRLVTTTGFEMFRETYNWQTFGNNDNQLLSDNNEKRQYENLFVQLESNIKERVFISAGLNGNLTRFKYTDHFTENGDQSGNRSYKPVLSPRLGVNVLLNDENSVFGNISHGFSTPSFEETLMPEGSINPDIKPESGWSFETGFRTQITNRFKLSASYYRIYVDNLLVAHRTGEDAYVGVNAGQSVHPGFEAEFTWVTITHNKDPLLTMCGSATLANFHFNDFVNMGTDYSGNLLPGTAKETFSIGTNLIPINNLSISGWYRYNGKMPVDDANSTFSDAFGLTNVEISYKGKKGNFKFDVRGGVQNIFDIHYASMLAVNAPSFGGNPPRYYYPGNPRNFYLSILIGFTGKNK